MYGTNDTNIGMEMEMGATAASHTDIQNTGICDVVNSTHVKAKSCDQIASDPNCMPQWAVGMCQHLENIQLTLNVQNTKWSAVEKQLENQNLRMTNIET